MAAASVATAVFQLAEGLDRNVLHVQAERAGHVRFEADHALGHAGACGE